MPSLSEITFPAPNQYDDWRSWAASLINALQMSEDVNHNFPLYVRDESKPRDGLPAAAEGDVIRVLDSDKKIRFYYWNGSAWANVL